MNMKIYSKKKNGMVQKAELNLINDGWSTNQ